MLDDARQTGYDMENIAGDVKFNLAKQGDQLQNQHRHLEEMDDEMRVGSKTMDQIQRGRCINKAILGGVIGILALAFCAAVFFKFS